SACWSAPSSIGSSPAGCACARCGRNAAPRRRNASWSAAARRTAPRPANRRVPSPTRLDGRRARGYRARQPILPGRQRQEAAMARAAHGDRVFVALDTTDLPAAETLARRVAGIVGGIKIGKAFFTAHGPQGVRRVCAAVGLPLFLDLKFHDIPNTVAGAVRAALALKPRIVNVHAAGGTAMMQAAAEIGRAH